MIGVGASTAAGSFDSSAFAVSEPKTAEIRLTGWPPEVAVTPALIAVGDFVKFRSSSRLRQSFKVAPDDVGKVTGQVDDGTSLRRINVHFPGDLVRGAEVGHFELVVPASADDAKSSLVSPSAPAVEEWLRRQSPDVALVFSARAALRVLPTITLASGPTGSRMTRRKMVLQVFRALATAWAAAAYPGHRDTLRTAAHVALSDFDMTAPAGAAAAFALSAASAANRNDANGSAAAAVENARVAAAQDTEFFAELLQALAIDADLLGQGLSPVTIANSKLWPKHVPEFVQKNWALFSQELLNAEEHWEVWTEWYDARLGSPPGQNWNQASEGAFIDVPEQLPWDDGPWAVNTEIAARLAWITSQKTSPALPGQSPAPVRVEERNGMIAQVRDRDSPLRAAENDFDAWRHPILDHIQELSSGDFREGTNHSRARDRLVALGTLLPGSIADVKQRQFRIGYEIERFEGLIIAYRSGADDMPMLNAAALEDLDRLRIALKMGIDKLGRWAEFRREAAADTKREGDANTNEVSEALREMAAQMERQPKYFDPELPATFRFLAEAVKDRVGATKTIVYGAVKSAENLISFLGQRALGIGNKAIDAIEQHVVKILVLSFGGAALQLSGALPTAWAWLKPLLETLAKAGGG